MKAIIIFTLAILLVISNISCKKIEHPLSNNTEQSDDIVSITDDNSNLEKSIIADISFTATYYTVDDTPLYVYPDLSSLKLTIIPIFTALTILDHQIVKLPNNTSIVWVKIITQTEFTGWCRYDFISLIEKNVAATINISHITDKYGFQLTPNIGSGVSLDGFPDFNSIFYSSGYYIFAGNAMSTSYNAYYSHAIQQSKILQLSVEDNNVYIHEIDIVDGNIIILNEIILEFDGRTFVYNKTELFIYGGNIYINYLENLLPKGTIANNLCIFWYVGSIHEPIPDAAYRLTSDYFKTFTGKYIFDSYNLVDALNRNVNEDDFQNASIEISYCQDKKILITTNYDLFNFVHENYSFENNQSFLFSQTLAQDPFYSQFSRAECGSDRFDFFFYKGGIAYYSSYRYSNETELNLIEYTIFFKKAKL